MSNPTAMNNFDIQQSSLLDLLFAQRNKQYGAYVLRKYYNNRLYIALGVTLTAAFSIFLIAGSLGGSDPMAVLNLPKAAIVEIQKINTRPDDPKPVELPKAKTARPPVSTINNSAPVIVPDIKVTTPPPTIDDLGKRQIDNRTVVVPGGGEPYEGGPAPIESGQGPAVQAPAAPEEPKYVAHPSEAPYYPGGEAAWREYLASHINVPGDMESGEKRSVLVRFLVAEDGSVTGFEILRSAGASFDNEVLRVLRRMPKWKPARQNGHAVATSFQQPVTFQAPEE
jgi:protein TonB